MAVKKSAASRKANTSTGKAGTPVKKAAAKKPAAKKPAAKKTTSKTKDKPNLVLSMAIVFIMLFIIN